MCEITFDPGKFDTLCGPLVDAFASTLHDVNYTRPLVEAIVNQVPYLDWYSTWIYLVKSTIERVGEIVRKILIFMTFKFEFFIIVHHYLFDWSKFNYDRSKNK